jgi:esterase
MSPSIYHRQTGAEDGAPLIAIHGLFGSLENLGVVTRQLSDCYCVYALDLPNHGRSAHTNTITLTAMADAVVAWMKTVNLTKAHFLGHSLGGKVSMEIALRYPHMVDCLIVADIAPVAYRHRHQDVFDAFNAVDLAAIATRMDADKQMQPYVDQLSTRSFLLKNLEKSQDGHWFWRMNLDGLINAYAYLIAANSQDQPPFTGKVLFIKGEHSSYILPEHRDAILNLFPHASVKVINGTNHWLHAEKPDIFVGIVKRFLT